MEDKNVIATIVERVLPWAVITTGTLRVPSNRARADAQWVFRDPMEEKRTELLECLLNGRKLDSESR